MKQNGDARLAATPPTQPPDAPLVRAFWADAWETEENLSVDPGMAAAIKEWNTVYKDHPHARVQTHSTRTSPTVSDNVGGCRGKWISTRQAGSLETHC
jgi:hypothetical protein